MNPLVSLDFYAPLKKWFSSSGSFFAKTFDFLRLNPIQGRTLAKTVIDALEDRVEAEPGVKLISAGRPSSRLVPSDVVLILGATGELDARFADELIMIVRLKMQDESLIVEVHCVKELWHETSQ